MAVVLAPRCAACATPLEHPTRGPVCEACWIEVTCLTPPVRHDSQPATGPALDIPAEPMTGRLYLSGALRAPRTAMRPAQRARSSRRGPHSGPSAIDRSVSAGRYDGALRHIIHAFKYDGRRTLSAKLGALMCVAGTGVLSGADCVVPVPLHPWRRLTRGFNQAADLAARLDLPIAHALWRTRATVPQTGLTAGGRRRNVRGAFSLSPLLSARVRQTILLDGVVVLVDDVRTTGATLEACAQVLKAAGVREVRALTVAFAESPGQRT
jgi:ComF family protein